MNDTQVRYHDIRELKSLVEHAVDELQDLVGNNDAGAFGDAVALRMTALHGPDFLHQSLTNESVLSDYGMIYRDTLVMILNVWVEELSPGFFPGAREPQCPNCACTWYDVHPQCACKCHGQPVITDPASAEWYASHPDAAGGPDYMRFPHNE